VAWRSSTTHRNEVVRRTDLKDWLRFEYSSNDAAVQQEVEPQCEAFTLRKHCGRSGEITVSKNWRQSMRTWLQECSCPR
jgi:hypothetical protein